MGEAKAIEAFVKLVRATNALSCRVHQHLADERLTESQFGVLEALHHLGALNQGELCRKILKTGGNLTVVVDNLERRGLVRRERDSGDRRVVNVHLTPAGDELIERVLPRQVQAIVRELGCLTEPEQEQLATLCRKLGRGPTQN